MKKICLGVIFSILLISSSFASGLYYNAQNGDVITPAMITGPWTAAGLLNGAVVTGISGNCNITGLLTAETVTSNSPYYYFNDLDSEVSSAGDITEQGLIVVVVNETGTYEVSGYVTVICSAAWQGGAWLRVGSSSYASAAQKSHTICSGGANYYQSCPVSWIGVIPGGQSVHLGGYCVAASGTRKIVGNDTGSGDGTTALTIKRIN